MIDLIKAVILGIVQGITEFLPISSTGHLIVTSALLDFNALGGTFEIFIQLGAVVAVVLFYRADLIAQIRSVRSDARVRRFWLALLVAFIPAAGMGFLLRDFVKGTLYTPVVVALALIGGGIALIIIERRRDVSAVETTKQQKADAAAAAVPDISLRQALLIGLVQTLALIPGVSRAASSIIGGLFAGLDRAAATRFSFYLAIPTLGAATVGDLVLNLDALQANGLALLLVGTVVSGVVAFFAVGWLLRYISAHTFIPFGYYRIAAGILILSFTLVGFL